MMMLQLIGNMCFLPDPESIDSIQLFEPKKFVCNIFCNRLLDREQAGDEEATLDDEEEDGFLKAFKVIANIIFSGAFTLQCLY